MKLKILAFAVVLTLATNLSAQTQINRLTYATDWGKGETNSAFAGFDSWANQFTATSNTTSKAQVVSDGVLLAKERRRAFAELIKTDPEKALVLTVPASIRQRLPAVVVNELETRVSGIGDYSVIAALPAKGGPPVEPIQRFVHLNGQTYHAYVYGRRLGETCKYGIPLHGVILDGVMAMHESALRELETDETPEATKQVIDLRTSTQQSLGASTPKLAEMGGTIYRFVSPEQMQQAEARLEAAEKEIGPEPLETATNIMNDAEQSGGGVRPLNSQTPWTTSLKKVLVIQIDFSDLPEASDASYFQNIADTQISPYYLQSSFGLTSLTNTVTTQVYRMPQTSTYYATNGANDQLFTDAETAAAADYIVTNYDRVIVHFPALWLIPGSKINYGGQANVGGPNVWDNGEFDFRIIAHELGHTYGLLHAGLWQVNDNNPISGAGVNVEYGDDFDTMGTDSPDDTRTDFNPYFKNILGWISDAQVQTVTSRGIYRIFAFDFDNCSAPSYETLALKIADNNNRNYWVGCRRNFTDNPFMENGAYIIWGYKTPVPASGGGDMSDLLDMTTPGSSPSSGVNSDYDAALAIGATFADTNAQISISPVSEGGMSPNEYIDVQITVSTNQVSAPFTPLTITTFAGSAGISGTANGNGTNALFQWPWGITVDSTDNIYVTDWSSVRKITPSGLVSTLSYFSYGLRGIAADKQGNLYVADSYHHTIDRVTPTGAESTLAGLYGVSGSADGTGSNAWFNYPGGIAVDAQTNIFVTDSMNNMIRRISPDATGLYWTVNTIAGTTNSGNVDGVGTNARFNLPDGIAVDNATNIYVADTINGTIRKITVDSTGTNWGVTTIAGGNSNYYQTGADGIGTNANFSGPYSITMNKEGKTLYVADAFDNTIRKMTLDRTGTNWIVTTIAGLAYKSGNTDGTGTNALFNGPYGIAVDSSTNIYITDFDNYTVRLGKFNPVVISIPTLYTTHSNNRLTLSWPISAGNYALESSTNLQTANWVPVLSIPLIINGQASVTNQISDAARFYRLKQQ